MYKTGRVNSTRITNVEPPLIPGEHCLEYRSKQQRYKNEVYLFIYVFPFGKYEYQRLPMGVCTSQDIFQEKMSGLMTGLEFVRIYLDDILCITCDTFEKHLEQLEQIFI